MCGIGAAVSFIPVGLSVAHATTTKTIKATAKTTAKKPPKATAKKPPKATAKKPPKATVKKSGTFLGPSTMTPFGPVQVSVTVNNGKITKVNSPVYPMGTYRDQQINTQAIPMLEQEVMQVQSSKIQGIGGASYTSEGFYMSLIPALVKAGLK